MSETVLSAQKRDLIGKQVKKLRREGILPGIMYGKNIDSMAISLDEHQVNRVLAAVSSSQLIKLEIDGENYTTLVRDRQRHPVTGNILHIDFYEVSMTEKLRTDISIVVRGDAPAVKNYGGILVTGPETLEVECLPQDLPERFIVDISNLEEIGDSIFVRDIIMPEGVELITDPEELVIVVTMPVAEEEEIEEEVEITEEEPEVIERGKKDEEEAEEGIEKQDSEEG